MSTMRATLLFCLLITACRKSGPESAPVAPHPQMIYKDLHDAEVSYQQQGRTVDVDGDGATDFRFYVQLVGDPVLQRDRLQFLVNSAVKRNLLNDANDQSPRLQKTDTVSTKHKGYDWWEISNILLSEKIITDTNTSWEGLWKDASQHYLPIQLDKNGKLYNGWIELSFSTDAEKLILHKTAVSVEENKTVQAGI